MSERKILRFPHCVRKTFEVRIGDMLRIAQSKCNKNIELTQIEFLMLEKAGCLQSGKTKISLSPKNTL